VSEPHAALPPSPVTPLAWQGGWRDGALALLDQTLLPREERMLRRRASAEVVTDIQRLAVRGAPLLGIAGAYALVLAWREALEAPAPTSEAEARFAAGARSLAHARPTAVNLPWAVASALARTRGLGGAERGEALLAHARALEAQERAACAAIARHGADLLGTRTRVLTHCNAGALVTPGLGTALAPLYLLHHRGAPVHVWVDETRPLLQGLRLTAYELGKAGVAHTVIADDVAPGLMRQGLVDAAIVGADRVCRNGDVVNKVGTYAVALACRAHDIPFYVAAPRTTFDAATARGADVPIEERRGDAARYLLAGTAPPGAPTFEPAFDVTPAALVTALVTEAGALDPLRLPSSIFGASRG
jgi:methylthioribose-1-phosphate isomerase